MKIVGSSKTDKRLMNGAVFVELAITLPLFIGIFLMTIEVSHAISEYKVLLNQVRSASRYLESQSPGNQANQYAIAKCLVVTATPDCSAPALMRALTVDLVQVADAVSNPATHLLQSTRDVSGAVGAGTLVNLVSVSVTGYKHPIIFGTTEIIFSPISATSRQVN